MHSFQEAFGQDFQVFLDTYHGLNRVRSKVKRDDVSSPIKQTFFRELSISIRQTEDHGDIREMITPTSEEIKSNLMNLHAKWSNSSIPVKALDAIKQLSKHPQCLSGIKPGEGTNGNESK